MIKAIDLLPRARDRDTIVMAELPDGRQFKLTGYERASVWARRPDMAPIQVNVVVVPVRDTDEAARLYDEFEQLLSEVMM